MLWLVGFTIWFYSFELPHTRPNNQPMRRLDIWQQVPFLLLDLVDPPAPEGDAPASGWRFLPQRFGILAIATVILACAYALGSLLLRMLGRRFAERIERIVFAFALGLAGLSLFTLGCGLAGWLSRALFISTIVAACLGELGLRIRERRGERSQDKPLTNESPEFDPRWHWAGLAVVAPFLLLMLFGAMTPSIDFDVKEYHLQGPKEFFQAGRIEFLEHNVYTSFPFLTEMLSLFAMVLRGDWFHGALAGKVVLMTFAPLTGLALFAAGRRWFGPTAGWLAAIVFLTTPWTYRISIVAYAEGGLTFYLFATLLAVMSAIEAPREERQPSAIFLILGLLAGTAMACKYPGMLSVVIPTFGVVAVWAMRQPVSEIESRFKWKVPVAFVIGTVITVGPWLVKNSIETGNPVYPLLYSVLGGRDWNANRNAQWVAAHSPDDHDLTRLPFWVSDVTARSDWLSPLLYGLAPLAFLMTRRRRCVGWLWSYLAYLFATWWLFTHRIDRFWVPMLPVVALLAGAGATWTSHRIWKRTLGVVMAAAVLFNLGFISTPSCGYNAYLTDLVAARRIAEETSPAIAFLNESLPTNSKVLCVGEAQVFDARFPLVYNTVFDDAYLERWCRADTGGGLRSRDEILRRLQDEGLTHVFVNWQEIERYRNSYGFPDFVSRETFDRLKTLGVLDEPLPTPSEAWQVYPVKTREK
jgi:4-amino-4-deoxy-L-arabinose transferase-like glycosyltransferase